MLLKSIILFYLCTSLSNGERRDFYTGEIVTEQQSKEYEKEGVLKDCTMEIAPCNETDGRRIDGACYNLNHPGKGLYLQPLTRVLPASFCNGSYERTSVSGNALPSPRKVRLNTLKSGESNHALFNHNIGNFLIFLFNDIGSVHDIENMLLNTTNCCEEGHMNDYKCTPNVLEKDDPVHRFSGIRCMNSTRPLTHQDYGCTKDPVPSPISKTTPAYDLSQIYNMHNTGDKAVRSFCGGKLKVEEEEGRTFPPNGPTAFCPNNEAGETRCFENHFNSLLPISLFIIWFVRNHNKIADQLAEVNPHWDDDKLFYIARDINIAWSQRMYLYEVMPALQGRDHLIAEGIISEDGGFRDLYDETTYPEVTMEYTYIVRWFHLMQQQTAKYYDEDGAYLRDFPLFNITFRMGYMPKHMVELTQSTFRAPCRAFDYTVSYDIADRGLPNVQTALDVTAGDLNKGRNFGIAPFIDYVYHFTGRNITCFDDLEEFIPEYNIELLKETYECVEDIDLLAAQWVSKKMKGGEIPYMVACIMNDQIMRTLKSDRHYFERKDRLYAFTEPQLKQMHKASLSLLLCEVGDGVKEVPTNSFLNICPTTNPLVSCNDIPQIDFSVWAEETSTCDE